LALDTSTTKRFFVSYYQQYQCSFWPAGEVEKDSTIQYLRFYADWPLTAQLKRRTCKYRYSTRY